YPLNNRWWLKDEFAKIRGFRSEAEKVRRLSAIAAWEHPGPGSFYDDLGNVAKSPHVSQSLDIGPEEHPEPTASFWWWEQGKSRARLSWQTTMWPRSIIYQGLDPEAAYLVRSTGSGQQLLRINGDRITPSVSSKQMGGINEFVVPAEYVKGRKLVLTWERPTNEEHLNWRDKSRVAEVWLIKQHAVH